MTLPDPHSITLLPYLPPESLAVSVMKLYCVDAPNDGDVNQE